MKIEQIVCFVKIARTQSITLAAEQLHISQPAISVSLSDLEAELGVKLFNRSRHGTQLTEQGKRLLGEAEKILQAWENLKTRADIESYSMQDGLCLSAVPSLSFSFMPQLIQRFKDNFPQISIKLFSGGSGQKTCPTCHGSGQVARGNGFFQMASTCPTCHGRGQVIDNPCASCHGTGLTKKSEKLSVSIPCGTDDGTKLVLRGKGNAGPNGGPAGDLIIFVRVKEDKYFVREGRNVFLQVPISFTQAALGCEIEVPVVEGGKVRVSIPAGIQSGKSLRLKNRGVPAFKGNPDDRGDMYLTVLVETPKHLGLKARSLMKELQQALGEDKSPDPIPFER